MAHPQSGWTRVEPSRLMLGVHPIAPFPKRILLSIGQRRVKPALGYRLRRRQIEA